MIKKASHFSLELEYLFKKYAQDIPAQSNPWVEALAKMDSGLSVNLTECIGFAQQAVESGNKSLPTLQEAGITPDQAMQAVQYAYGSQQNAAAGQQVAVASGRKLIRGMKKFAKKFISLKTEESKIAFLKKNGVYDKEGLIKIGKKIQKEEIIKKSNVGIYSYYKDGVFDLDSLIKESNGGIFNFPPSTTRYDLGMVNQFQGGASRPPPKIVIQDIYPEPSTSPPGNALVRQQSSLLTPANETALVRQQSSLLTPANSPISTTPDRSLLPRITSTRPPADTPRPSTTSTKPRPSATPPRPPGGDTLVLERVSTPSDTTPARPPNSPMSGSGGFFSRLRGLVPKSMSGALSTGLGWLGKAFTYLTVIFDVIYCIVGIVKSLFAFGRIISSASEVGLAWYQPILSSSSIAGKVSEVRSDPSKMGTLGYISNSCVAFYKNVVDAILSGLAAYIDFLIVGAAFVTSPSGASVVAGMVGLTAVSWLKGWLSEAIGGAMTSGYEQVSQQIRGLIIVLGNFQSQSEGIQQAQTAQTAPSMQVDYTRQPGYGYYGYGIDPNSGSRSRGYSAAEGYSAGGESRQETPTRRTRSVVTNPVESQPVESQPVGQPIRRKRFNPIPKRNPNKERKPLFRKRRTATASQDDLDLKKFAIDLEMDKIFGDFGIIDGVIKKKYRF